MKLSRRLLCAALATAIATQAFSGGVAVAAPTASSPPVALDSIGQPIGPLTDPDAQFTDANGVAYGLPNPGDKRTAPARDLVKYPEKSKAQVEVEAANEKAARATQDATRNQALDDPHSAETVITEESLPNGEAIKVTIYEPLPGVAPEKLVERLKASGKGSARVKRAEHHEQPTESRTSGSLPSPSSVEQASVTAFAGPDDCTNGAANWWICLPVYWTNNGYADPIIRINDHTSSAWKTTDATYLWNAVPNIRFDYVWNSCPYLAGARCVDAWNANYGPTDWIGEFTYYVDSSNSRKMYEPNSTYPQKIRLNDYYNPAGTEDYGPFSRTTIVMHEVGHVTGLGHNNYGPDLMYASNDFSTTTGGENADLVANVYSVTR